MCKEISDTERRLFALPYRLGGLGIVNPVESADAEYERSKAITSELTSMIFAEEEDYWGVTRNITMKRPKKQKQWQ